MVEILNALASSGLSEKLTIFGTYSLYAYEAAAGIRFETDVLGTGHSGCDAKEKLLKDAINGNLYNLNHADELFAFQTEDDCVLMNSEKCSVMVVSNTGRMARMNTLSPFSFAAHRRWLAEQPGREPAKRARDIFLAELIEAVAAEYFPQLQ